ncbi:MAG: 50S ribosomal protein L13 [Deltaproteobacteria bacterium]|nr:50S ribosomal protein L13 [Deltaproteobacteria bacterium]
MTTRLAKPSEIARRWLLVDCRGQTLGRLATRIADVLRGKTKPIYTPHVDTGDFVVAINAREIRLTGQKLVQKRYWRHSGFPGGISSKTAGQLRETAPERILLHAVKGMLPKNALARHMLTKLKVYPGVEHPHSAQKPEAL